MVNGLEVTAQELARRLATATATGGQPPFVLDVRGPDEVAAWPFPGAVNIPLDRLDGFVDLVPADCDVVVLCASGMRSGRAVSLLRGRRPRVRNLAGGMQAWSTVHDVAVTTVGATTVVQIRRPARGCLSYVIASGGEAAVVDPSIDVDVYRDVLDAHGWRLVHVLETHLHADHVSGSRRIAERLGGTLRLRADEGYRFPFEPLDAGARLRAGDAVLTANAVPGHTPGSTMFVLDDAAAFTGDALLLDAVGRPDLGEDAESRAALLHRSLRRSLAELPDDCLVFPAHAAPTAITIGGPVVADRLRSVRRRVPLVDASEAAFVAGICAGCGPLPANQVDIVAVNRGDVDPSAESLPALEAGPNRCAAPNPATAGATVTVTTR